MSQWKQDNNGKYKRVHKRQWCRGACMVYYYKTIGIADVYTAKPKGKFPFRFPCQSVGGIKRR